MTILGLTTYDRKDAVIYEGSCGRQNSKDDTLRLLSGAIKSNRNPGTPVEGVF